MSDASNAFGFGKFVPGFDFLQSLAKGASDKLPQMPNLSSWVAPTINVEELEKRIAELKAGTTKGGAREAALRALVYIGMGGEGVDERAFNELRQIRAENHGVPLQAFKQTLREQYFSLVLDPEGALAAIPAMLPDDAASRAQVLQAIRRILNAVGPVTGERAQRLARVEQLIGAGKPAVPARKAARATRKTA